MRDLNKTLFFRTQFTVTCDDGENDILWQVVLKTRKWMCDKWQNRGYEIPRDYSYWTKLKFGGRLTSTDANETVSFKSTFFSPEMYAEEPVEDIRTLTAFEWACVITEAFEVPCRAPRDWTSEISYVQEKPGEGVLSVVISYADRPGYLGPVQDAPFFNVPRIVRWFLTDRNLVCKVGDTALSMQPFEVTEENLPEFWNMLSDPARELPVVYVSPRIDEEGNTTLLVEPKDLVWVLGPNALVAYAADTAVSRAMLDVVQSDSLRCTGGTVRVYAERPRFDEPGESNRHRFFSAHMIEEQGAETIVSYIGRALSQDVHYYHNILRRENVDAHVRRAKFVKTAREKRLAQVAETEEQVLEDMVSLEEQLESSREEADVYAAEVDDLNEQLFNAKCQVEALKMAMNASCSDKPHIKLEAWPPSPEGIVRLFLAAYPDRFDLTENAWGTLKDCTTNPDILWNALNDLVTVAWPLYDAGAGDVEKEFCNRSRFELAKTEGKMTKADPKLAAGYDDVYNGTTYSCMAHIINGVKESDGKFIRIYFCFARQEGKIIVSHIGKHKTNYLSGKI